MDFESFLDFVLALENKDTSEGLTYLFRCLDLQNRGFLTTVDIHTLFRQMLSIFLYIFLSVVEDIIMLLIWLIVRPNHLNLSYYSPHKIFSIKKGIAVFVFPETEISIVKVHWWRFLQRSKRGFCWNIFTCFLCVSFCRDVHRKWIEGGNYDLCIEDVRDEIWDMVKPQDPLRLTLQDLLQCRQGGTVASMLTDVRGFWAHDNRENLLQEEEEVEEEE